MLQLPAATSAQSLQAARLHPLPSRRGQVPKSLCKAQRRGALAVEHLVQLPQDHLVLLIRTQPSLLQILGLALAILVL